MTKSAQGDDSTERKLSDALVRFARHVPGVSPGDRATAIQHVGVFFCRMRNVEYIQKIRDQWRRWLEKGRLNISDSLKVPHGESADVMIAFFEHGAPDDISFQFIKRLFFQMSLSPSTESPNLMRTGASLASGDMAVLFCAYKISLQSAAQPQDEGQWLGRIADSAGLSIESVRRHLRNLDERGLINQKNGYRFSHTASTICQFVDSYDDDSA
ncbi:MAG: hypothetical protein GC154_00990 [bacterium]|nr:hypothetical protein [bacterium]